MRISRIMILLAACTTISAAQTLLGLRTIMEVSYINSNYALGSAMLGLGDINDDGKPDFAVSAEYLGKTFIYFGGKGVLDSLPDLVLKGGSAMAKGDLNGDGRMDLLVATRDSLLVYYGKDPTPIALDTIPGLVISGLGINDWRQISFAVGDLNHDGFDDLIIGYTDYGRLEGKVYVFLGSQNPTSVPSYTGVGDTVGSEYGMKVAIADINGDGVPDLAVSSEDARGFETIDIYYGHPGWIYSKNGYDQRIDSREGNFAALAYFDLVDVNADHRADISFGYGDSTHVFYGKSDSISHLPDLILTSPDPSFYNGFQGHASNIGDINGDGKDDFALKAWPGGPAVCLIVYLGGSLPQPVAGRCRGFVGSAFDNIVGLGDVDGDGVNDFGATAPFNALGEPPQDGYFVILSGDKSLVASVQHDSTIPKSASLSQNFPNPFNPRTTIQYTLAAPAQVLLMIYDQTGKKVRQLVDERQGDGLHTALWDGRSTAGNSVASGVYYYTLVVDGIPRETKQSLLVK